MSILTPHGRSETYFYPESDGKPMADNTIQYRYITTIKGGLDGLFFDRPDVFIAGDLLWYPVERNRDICAAPDVLVAFGRPKGDRGSYVQCDEEGIPPQVVFEILSPNNTRAEMRKKLEFYESYGAEEYYLYDPETGRLAGWLRHGPRLEAIPVMLGWTSPRLGIRFELEGKVLNLYNPDGRRFIESDRIAREAYLEHQRAERAQRERVRERARAEREAARAEREAARAEKAERERAAERTHAEQEAARANLEAARADLEAARAQHERAYAERLASRLKALGIDPTTLGD